MNGQISGEWVVQTMVEDTKEYFFTQILKQPTVVKYFK